MKEKDLVCFYKIFANLYGAILDSDAFDIIKRFYPDFTYEEFHKDLKKRAKKFDRSYSVRKWDKDSYVIKDALSIKEIRSLFIFSFPSPVIKYFSIILKERFPNAFKSFPASLLEFSSRYSSE